MDCNPTVQKVAQAIYRDPMADRVEPGKCRLCGRTLAAAFHDVETGFGVLNVPNAACESAKQLYERASHIAELMKVEAKKWRAHQIELGREERLRQQDRDEDEARAALGIHRELTRPKPEVSTGEF